MKTLAGVYEIRNAVNGKRYIGSSQDVKNRFVLHRYALENNKHHNPPLQNAWNKYGADCFEFNVLLICDTNMTLVYEQKCIDDLRPKYNIGKNATAPMRGRKLSNEHKQILIELNKTRVWTEQSKQKIRDAGKGRKFYIGYRHTEEVLQKRRKKIVCPNNGITYNSIKEAAEKLSVNRSKISAVARGKRNHTGGYRFVYAAVGDKAWQ